MKYKIILMSLIVSAQLVLWGAVIPEEQGSVSGLIRLGYINQHNEASTDTYATVLGGILKYETPVWNDVKLGVAGYASQKLHFATGSWDEGKTNLDFLSENGNSFAYIGEAYVDYNANDINVRIGRQLIDTPMDNRDDIRMLPNTTEAVMANYSGIDKTIFTAGVIRRFAGYDSGGDISKFKKPAEGSHGAYLIGVTNESIQNTKLQGWYYSIDKSADIFYTDGVYKIEFSDDDSLNLMAQFVHFSEDTDYEGASSGVDGNVYGIAVNLEKGLFSTTLAYNQAFHDEEKSLNFGFSGGAYYTSMEEWAIDGMNDAKAYVGSVSVDLADTGMTGLSLTTAYGEFKGKSVTGNVKVDEWDMIMEYEYDDAFSADVSFAMIQDKHDNADEGSDGGYNRLLARLHYRF